MISRFGPKCSDACLAIFCGALKKAKTTTTTLFLAKGSKNFGRLFAFGVWGVLIYYKNNTLELPVGWAKFIFWAGGYFNNFNFGSPYDSLCNVLASLGRQNILCVTYGGVWVSKPYCV